MPVHSAAELLDSLSDWVLTRVSDLPKGNRYGDGAFLQAVERGQNLALKTYRSSGSFEEGLRAGKHGFDQELARHLVTGEPGLKREIDRLVDLQVSRFDGIIKGLTGGEELRA